MSKVTIEDISRHTELSRGTVSRALNNRPDISERTKQRVLKACAELKYVPSHAARSLATGRRYAIAVLVDDLRLSFAAGFVRGVISRAYADHYAVQVSELGDDPSAAITHLCLMAGERVDGLLLAATPQVGALRTVLDALGDRPLVASAALNGIRADVLMPDQAEIGRLAARHMLNAVTTGLFYVHEAGSTAADERLAGFQEVCRAAGLEPEQITITVAARGPTAGNRLEPVRARLDGIRALVASDDYLALELMSLCQQAGRVPGRDIAVMGQGNELAGSMSAPTLTTIDPRATEIGQRAMDMMLQRIDKTRQDASQQLSIPPMLAARESTRLLK